MKPAKETMTAGNVAKQARIKIDTIRYYERRGLLPRSPRSAAGYRILTEATIQRLRFIKHAKGLGFTLREVKQLLDLRVTAAATCADVRQKAEAKVSDMEDKIRSLQAMKRALRQLVAACTADGLARECSFLTNLNRDDVP